MKREKQSIRKWKIVIVMLAWCILGLTNVEMREVKAETYGDYEYRLINNDTEVEITGYKGSDKEIVIPSEIDGKSVTSIGDSAFFSCSELSSIEIPSGVTSIGNYAFSICRELSSIVIPSSVISIGDSAFFSCSGLSSIEIPSGVLLSSKIVTLYDSFSYAA